MLIDKIKEYYKTKSKILFTDDEIKLLAKDIAEICEKEENAYWKGEFERVANNYEKIWQENLELKQRKTLDRNEVEQIIVDLVNSKTDIDYGTCDSITGNPMKDYVLQKAKIVNKTIDKLLELAIPKDRIIEVLKDNKDKIAFELFRAHAKSEAYWRDFISGLIVILYEIIGE